MRAKAMLTARKTSVARLLLLALTLPLALTLAVTGCSESGAPRDSEVIGPAVAPAPADLGDPQSAVESYLDWVSYAYRIGDSDVASPTMSAEEEVRVNSYAQLNTERQRRILQVLVSFRPGLPSMEGTRATLSAAEAWEYRYLAVDGMKAISATYTTSYETTYHLMLSRPGVWVVDSVDARPQSQVR